MGGGRSWTGSGSRPQGSLPLLLQSSVPPSAPPSAPAGTGEGIPVSATPLELSEAAYDGEGVTVIEPAQTPRYAPSPPKPGFPRGARVGGHGPS